MATSSTSTDAFLQAMLAPAFLEQLRAGLAALPGGTEPFRPSPAGGSTGRRPPPSRDSPSGDQSALADMARELRELRQEIKALREENQRLRLQGSTGGLAADPTRSPPSTPTPQRPPRRGQGGAEPPRTGSAAGAPRLSQGMVRAVISQVEASVALVDPPYGSLPIQQVAGEAPVASTQGRRVLLLGLPLGTAAAKAESLLAASAPPKAIVAATPVRAGMAETDSPASLLAAAGAPASEILARALSPSFSFIRRKVEMEDTSGAVSHLQRQELLLVTWVPGIPQPAPPPGGRARSTRPAVARSQDSAVQVVDLCCTIGPGALLAVAPAGTAWRELEPKVKKHLGDIIRATGAQQRVHIRTWFRSPGVEAIVTLPATEAMRVLHCSGRTAGVFFRPWAGGMGAGLPANHIVWLHQQREGGEDGALVPAPIYGPEAWEKLSVLTGFCGIIPSKRPGHWGVRLAGEVQAPESLQRAHTALGLASPPPCSWVRVRHAPRSFYLKENHQPDATAVGLGTVVECVHSFGWGADCTFDLRVECVPPTWPGMRLTSETPGVLDQSWSRRAARPPRPGAARVRPPPSFVVPHAGPVFQVTEPSLVPLREGEARELAMLAEERAAAASQAAAAALQAAEAARQQTLDTDDFMS